MGYTVYTSQDRVLTNNHLWKCDTMLRQMGLICIAICSGSWRDSWDPLANHTLWEMICIFHGYCVLLYSSNVKYGNSPSNYRPWHIHLQLALFIASARAQVLISVINIETNYESLLSADIQDEPYMNIPLPWNKPAISHWMNLVHVLHEIRGQVKPLY